MEKLKILFVTAIICNVLIANAQERRTQDTIKKDGTTSLLLSVKMDSASIVKQLSKIKGVLAVEIDANNQILSIKYDNANEKVVEEINKSAKKINAKLVEYVKPIEKPAQKAVEKPTEKAVAVETFKFDPNIDKFLNIEDESIFSDEKFLNLRLEQIHPRSKELYLMIRNIYNLRKLLSEVSKLPLGQKETAKGKLSQAEVLIDEINKTDKCYKTSLSQRQKDFVRNLIDEEFNRLVEYVK